jgi:hypothetical protein
VFPILKAFYNAGQICDTPGNFEKLGCLEGTREELLAELEQWALDNAGPDFKGLLAEWHGGNGQV